MSAQSAEYAAVVNGILPGSRLLQRIPTMTVVAAALRDSDSRILVQQRAPGRAMAGLWEFPGGKVEDGEAPESALARELAEELGIAVEQAALRPACFVTAMVGERHMTLLLYLCERWEGEPVPLDATALQWARLDALRMLPMPPADAPLIDQLEKLL